MNINPTQIQTQKINKFKSITNINNDDIAYWALHKSNWNVNNCITSFFENPDNLLNHNFNNNDNNDMKNDEKNVDDNNNNNNNNDSSIYYYASYIPGLNQLGGLINGLFSYLYTFYPYIKSILNSSLSSSSSSSSILYSQILTEFKNKNPIFLKNNNKLIFRNIHFSELMNSSKCIFIYFNDINSNLCCSFNNNILSSSSVIDYLRLNMECWIGDKRNNNGNKLFSQITYQWNDKRLPFVCIAGIHPLSNKLVLVHRQYVGISNLTPYLFIANILDHGKQRWEQFKMQQIIKQQQSNSNRNLRQIQDEEYQKALLNEQQQQPQQPVPQQQQQQQQTTTTIISDQDNKEKDIQNQINLAKKKISSLSSLINSTSSDKLIKIALRLPNGKRVEHIFCNQNTIESLFDFALCYELKINDKYIDDFELVCGYPKRVFNVNDKQLTLEECGIVHSAMLFVQQKE